jgi:ABC-type sugar transport system ATPase subunit
MDKLATEGKSILMISSELPELIGMSDRIYIIREGKIVGEFERDKFSADDIAALMLGIEGNQNAS